MTQDKKGAATSAGAARAGETARRETREKKTGESMSEATAQQSPQSSKTSQAAQKPGAQSNGARNNDARNNGAENNGPQNGARNGAPAIDRTKTAKAAGAAKPTVSHMLGEVTWLLSQSQTHKHFAIGDLEWLVMPAILLEQFRVFHGDKHPLGFALWAEFSEEAEKRFLDQVNAGRGARLRPQDWKSGDRLWLIEIVAPFATPDNKLNEAMLADLIDNVFKTRPFKLHVIDAATGKREVKEVGA